jgi:RNA polymerase sigma factor (sigma-70 family)
VESWQFELSQGRPHAAWDLFIARYRRLIVATIRHVVRDQETAMDAFADVCESLRRNDLARLRRFIAAAPRARFSTWLVAVVRNLTIDWLRARHGRRRASVPAHLSAIQQAIYTAVFIEGRRHVEAFEALRGAEAPALTFRAFLRELRDVYRQAGVAIARHARCAVPSVPETTGSWEAVEADDARTRLASAMASLSVADRLAIELFVMDGLPAADVSRTIGLANAKAVYNRVYRALGALRIELERAGIGPRDL